MAEVFNQREGILSWVSASANTSGWSTAASSPSGIAIAYVRDFGITSGRTVNTVMNRGVPDHHKRVDATPLNLNLTYGYTGDSIPDYHVHLELFMSGQNGASAFHQVHNAIRTQHDFGEVPEENTYTDTFVAVSMTESTASGYLG